MSSKYINSLTPVALTSANAPQREILETAQKQVGFIPNIESTRIY